MKRLLILVFICLTFQLPAQVVKISGVEQQWANTDIVIYKYANFISHVEQELGRCTVDAAGNFNLQFPIHEITYAYMRLGADKGIIFLEPDSVYQIKLPPRVDKTDADKVNPFYLEEEFYIGITNANEHSLNYMIQEFELRYNKFIEVNATKFTKSGSKQLVEGAINKLDSIFPFAKNKYFNVYKKYRYATLRQLAFERNRTNNIKKYFCNNNFYAENVAFMQMFNQTFNDFLEYVSDDKEKIQPITDAITNKNISDLRKIVSNKLKSNSDTLDEMVLLKTLFDGYYQDLIPEKNVIALLEAFISQSSIDINRTIANNLIDRLNKLVVGTEAPNFTLTNSDNKLISLKQFAGKFVYINFAQQKNYTCLQEFELLKAIAENYKEILVVVTICGDESLTEMKKWFAQKNYSWYLLHYAKQPEVLEKYNIAAYPVYYLVSPEGKLVMSPAATPTEDFDYYFKEFVLSWERQQQINKESNYRYNQH